MGAVRPEKEALHALSHRSQVATGTIRHLDLPLHPVVRGVPGLG